MKLILPLALILSVSPVCFAWGHDFEVTAEYISGPNDTPDIATQTVFFDAAHKTAVKIASELRTQPEIQNLKLPDGLVDAFATALAPPSIELPEPADQQGKTLYRARATIQFDPAKLARRVRRLRRDQDASKELLELWKKYEATWIELEKHNAALSKPSAAKSEGALNDRRRALARLRVESLLLQASIALFKAEEGPASALLVMPGGRQRSMHLTEQALALAFDNLDAHYKLGDVFLSNARNVEAEEIFRAALKKDPASAAGHNKLGNALLSQGKTPEAAVEFREAIRLNAKDPLFHSDLGLTLNAQGDRESAVAEFREAIRVDPDYVDGHNNLAIALANQGRIPEAVDEFREIIRIHPDNALGHYNIAIALADMEKDAEATDALREAVRLNPGHYNAHYNLGEMLRLEGNLEESAKEFREYLRLAPRTQGTRRNVERAQAYAESFEEK